jgi:hypothetical protein
MLRPVPEQRRSVADFDSAMRRFKSSRPSKKNHHIKKEFLVRHALAKYLTQRYTINVPECARSLFITW